MGSLFKKAGIQFADGTLRHEYRNDSDMDINDRNRFILIEGFTQQQIHQETGASVSTKGMVSRPEPWRGIPLYLHIFAALQE
ncbi:hypothetical protein AX14_012941 [Amanita brunnescens Koide BX004]|nr:hypothetical protein AX14_012941 [Amanita brunnescens Koide BX004]